VKLADFQVAHQRSGKLDDVLVHCWDDQKLVPAFVSREGLDDYFHSRAGLTTQQRNLVVDRNLDVFKRIIENKYQSGECSIYSRLGYNYPRIDIELADIEQDGEGLTDHVLEVARMAHFVEV